MKENYPIISLSKADIIQAFADIESPKLGKVRELVGLMQDNEMIWLASKLSDDYCEQLFWFSLRSIFEGNFLRKDFGGK